MMRIFSALGLLFSAMLVSACCSAGEVLTSSKNEIFENPYIAIGVDPASKTITGYVAALRTEPGRTDSCKLSFAGKLDGANRASLQLSDATPEALSGKTAAKIGAAELVAKGKGLLVNMQRSALPGDCDWILEHIGSPAVDKKGTSYSIVYDGGARGDWIGIAVISQARAAFHKLPDDASATKAYLVAGDVINVYEDRPGWYYVKYQTRKKQTVGWIRKADTLRLGAQDK